MDDLISRQAVIEAVDRHTNEDGTLDDDITCILEKVPSAQPEYDDKEKKLLNMLFEIAYKMIEIQNGYMEIDYVSFDRGDLYNLAEKLGGIECS